MVEGGVILNQEAAPEEEEEGSQAPVASCGGHAILMRCGLIQGRARAARVSHKRRNAQASKREAQ